MRITLSLFAASLIAASASAQDARPVQRTPVLVELFTSEGCSSCPPADALLARLERDQPVPGAEIIILEEHVDYWDQLGWRDRFSSRQFTERQSEYSLRFHLPDIYTPQMVVAGQAQLVGSDSTTATHAIRRAAQSENQGKSLRLSITETRLTGKRIAASVSLDRPASDPSAVLYAAVVSPSETTQVRSGENGGQTLRHAGVVRSLTRIATLKDLAAPFAFSVPNPDPSRPLRLVLFAQPNGGGSVLAAVSTPVPSPANSVTSARNMK